jgi:uncharacterized protein (TIGR03643 family)
MKKNKITDLDNVTIEKIVSMAQQEKKPYEAIKKEFGIIENDINEIMKKRLKTEKFELWKKKAVATKPKPKQMKFNTIEEDDLDAKYYIKNKFD